MADVYRDGEVHVQHKKCATCIFHPGNRMQLEEGRVEDMVAEALANDSVITCHKTLYGQAEHNAACRGFYDLDESIVLRLAAAMDVLVFD